MARTAALALAVTLASCERRTEEVDVGFRGEARTNPLLAAQRTLERLGTTSRTQFGLLELPDTDALLITEAGRLRGRGEVLERFLDWVEAGGRAVVCLDGFESDKGSFNPFEGLDEFESEVEPAWANRPNALLEALDVERRLDPDVEDFGFAEFDGGDYSVACLRDDGVLAADAASGPVVRVPLGAGEVDVLTTGRIFSNHELGDEDHAEFLDALASLGGERPQAVIAFASSESLGALLVSRAPFALLAAAVLLLLWLWRAWPRFGPVEELDTTAMAGFTTHVEAVGRFLWKHDQGPALLASTRGQVLARVDARMPELHGASREALCDALAERTSFDAAEVDTLLHSGRRLRPSALPPTLQALARLRAEI